MNILLINDIPQRQWAAFGHHHGISYVALTSLRRNVLEIPENCGLAEWVLCFCRVFCEAFGLMGASCVFLADVLMVLYRECREHDVLPVLHDLYLAVTEYPAKGEERGYQPRIRSKLHSLLLLYGRQLAFERGLTPAMFIREGRSVVWQRPHHDPVRTFFILLDLEYCSAYLRHNPLPPDYHIVHVLDEGGFLFARKDVDTGEDIGSRLVRESRYFRVSYLCCEQNATRLSSGLCSNLGVQIAMRNQSTEIPFLGRVMNLTVDEQDELITLKEGAAVVRVSGPRLKRPVRVDVDEYRVQPVSDEALAELSRKTVEAFLRQTKPLCREPVRLDIQRKPRPKKTSPSGASASPPGPQAPSRAPTQKRTQQQTKAGPRPVVPQRPRRDPNRLPPDQELLLRTYEARPLVFSLLATVLSWAYQKVSRLGQKIVNVGIWDEGPTFAHNLKSFLLTERGECYCQAYGIKSQKDKSGDDRMHQVVANSSVCCVEDWIRERYPDVEPDVRIKGTAYQVTDNRQIEPDRLVTLPAGVRVALQVGYRQAPGTEAANLCLLAGMPESLAPDYCLFVACSVSHLQAVVQHVNRQLTSPDRSQDPERVREKIRMTHVGELLARKFDLSFMLKGP